MLLFKYALFLPIWLTAAHSFGAGKFDQCYASRDPLVANDRSSKLYIGLKIVSRDEDLVYASAALGVSTAATAQSKDLGRRFYSEVVDCLKNSTSDYYCGNVNQPHFINAFTLVLDGRHRTGSTKQDTRMSLRLNGVEDETFDLQVGGENDGLALVKVGSSECARALGTPSRD